MHPNLQKNRSQTTNSLNLQKFVDSDQFVVSDRNKGFTLIETVIYIGLLSVIISFVLVVFFQIVGSQNQNRDRVEVDAEANFLMQKIIWALVGAQTINQPAVNATSSLLSVSKYNYGSNPVVIDLSGRSLRIGKAGGAAANLNSARVNVNQITFTHLPASGNAPESMQINMQVVSADIERKATASTTLDNTIFLRK